MLNSNVPENLMNEILALVPDTLSVSDEYWRIVPNTEETFTYSVSSKRDILVRHSRFDRMGRFYIATLVTMADDGGVLSTTIRRASKQYSRYIEHVRYDAFPELNEVKTLDDDLREAIDVPYNGLEWHRRHKTSVHILPVSESDMRQVRKFYPTDLPNEIWAYVPDTNRKYVISTQSRGVILKRYRADGGILKAKVWQLRGGEGTSKYLYCCMTVGNAQKNSVSHQYVLKSFIPCPGDEYEVNHIDGDTYNNVLDNLEWVTRQENSDHYNHSPEMAEKRAIGYKHISEWGRAHQKEVQNRPEVNAKRGKSVSESWTLERKAKYTAWSKQHWNSLTDDEKQARIIGLTRYRDELVAKSHERLMDEG